MPTLLIQQVVNQRDERPGGWRIWTEGLLQRTSDDNLLSLQDLGPSSISYLRETLGLPSTDGVRPMGKKPA